MLDNKICKAGLGALVLSAVAAYAPAGHAALAGYSQDFETPLVAVDHPGELQADGWLVFGNVFDSGNNFLFGYGPFGAPNGGPGFSGLVTGQGGAAQGANQVSIYNDYNCCQPNNGHFNGTDIVEASVFQEQTIGASDIGSSWTFTFDVKQGNQGPGVTTNAFIKTLDPGAGFAQTNFITFDTTNYGTNWGTESITIDLSNPLLDGQLLQFGFSSTASNFLDTGVFYDNLNFAVPVPAAVWLFGSGLLGLVGVARRRRKG